MKIIKTFSAADDYAAPIIEAIECGNSEMICTSIFDMTVNQIVQTDDESGDFE